MQKLINSNSYKAIRHRKSLSVRGQRTHTNSRTQRKLARTRIDFILKDEFFKNQKQKEQENLLSKRKIKKQNKKIKKNK